jgi:predicted AlkP superfamily phosphohydrolase/phosphomutase
MAGVLLALSVLCLAACTSIRSASTAPGKRIVVLGIDGMDPNFLERHWDALPNLDRLRREGEFKRLGTTMPPQSPVAWSTFITGMDPGGHGIYDFVHRNPQTLAPFSSMSQSAEGGRTLSIGPYLLPLSSGKVRNFRHGKPFWQILSEHGIRSDVIRMPTNFPPVECEGESLAGMGTPDLRGTFRTFTFYPDDPTQDSRAVPGGQIVQVELKNHRANLRLEGPPNTLRKDRASTFVDLTADVDSAAPVARFAVEDTRFVLRQGEWSGWIHAHFPLIPGLKSAAGMFRVYAKQLQPNFEVYVSPVNIDPAEPDLPITAPAGFSKTLAKALGPFYTQGMAQDTAALRQHVFTRAEYLTQSREVSEEHLKVFRYELEHFHDGLLFYHFFGIDQNSHMLWGKYEDELLETYKLVDRTLGWVRERIGDATLIVMSDHGFTTFDRAVHLNTWLMKEGFLTLDDPTKTGDEELFVHVDWSRTQAYSVGLNGLYINQQGRERDGIVAPGAETDAVLRKISERLLAFRDPLNGKQVVTSVTLPRAQFHGDALESAPDLLVGYAAAYRSSWQTALGAVPPDLIDDNTDEWRGDHCIDSRVVPGVLLSNRKSRLPDPQLADITVTILNEFGVPRPAQMIGRAIF